MMASMGPSFTPHPGAMPQHPGHPQGHPGLAPGMAHNPSQPGQPGAIPQHIAAQMGVSGPGGPQMNPAAMMAGGMPPGAGSPGVHAMQHLTPQQAMLFQQQQQQQQQQMNHMAMVNNPAIQAQLQQQRILQQQQQQRQQMMLQQQHGGMYNPNLIQANQLAALRRMGQNIQDPRAQAMLAHQNALNAQQMNNQGHNPNQLQLQQAQLAAMQQAQQAQAQQAQQAQAQAQAQQAQAVAAAQQAQAQHAQAHAHAQAHQAQQAQHVQAQQAHQQQQAHAQQVQHAQQAHQAAQQAGQPQLQQQTPQPGMPGQSGPSQPQTPQQPGQPGGPPPSSGPGGPHMTPQMAGQPHPPQPGSGGPQHPHQMQQQIPPQMQAQMQQHSLLQQNSLAMQQAQAQQQFANSLQQQQKREPVRNQCLLKLVQFSEMLGSFPGPKGRDETPFWSDFIARFFSTSGVFRHSIHMVNGGEKTNKQYEIPFPALARYFHTYFESGVKKMQIITDRGFVEKSINDKFCVENSKASMVQWFEGNAHVVSSGILRVNFDADQKFELFEFVCDNHEEFLPRKMVIQAAQPGHKWIKEWRSLNQADGKQSPEISKKGKLKPMKSPQTAPPDVQLPHSSVKESVGITEAVYQFLEVVEVMGHMTPLFMHCHTHPDQTAIASLDQLVQHLNNTTGGPVAMQPGGPRTPGMGQFPMGASPHVPHVPAPGSPHVGSPAPGTMQAPGMHPSQSQQGTASSGPSANTSPAGTKRRRPSGVKMEDDMNGGPTSAPTPIAQVNGLQGKAKPPTPRMQKKQKVST